MESLCEEPFQTPAPSCFALGGICPLDQKLPEILQGLRPALGLTLTLRGSLRSARLPGWEGTKAGLRPCRWFKKSAPGDLNVTQRPARLSTTGLGELVINHLR